MYLKTQKQIQSLADSLQQIQQQQLLLQLIALPVPSPKNSDNTLQNPICQAPLPALPNKFDRDHSKGQTFLCSCQTYILLCPESLSNDQIKIVWALSYMKSGRAAKWAAHIFKWEEENKGYTKFLDWDNFKFKFCKEFCPANSDSTTINKLESTTYYQRTWSVDDYLDEFLDLIAESGYMDPRTLVVKFRKGLDPQIQNAVATMTNRHPSDTALTAWYEAARNIDQNRASNKAFQSAHHTPPLFPVHSTPLFNPLSNPLRHTSGQLQVIQYPWILTQVGGELGSLQCATTVVKQAIKSQTAPWGLTCKH